MVIFKVSLVYKHVQYQIIVKSNTSKTKSHMKQNNMLNKNLLITDVTHGDVQIV